MHSTNPFVITDQLVDDLLCNALEGGITYWATAAKPRNCPADATSKMFPGEPPYASEMLTLGATIDIMVDPELVDDDKVKRHNDLTLAAMKRGIKAWCGIRGVTPAALEEDADASDGDCCVQMALFGQVVFG
jgi:hypothetical protein